MLTQGLCLVLCLIVVINEPLKFLVVTNREQILYQQVQTWQPCEVLRYYWTARIDTFEIPRTCT
jgi:hypothetical protein